MCVFCPNLTTKFQKEVCQIDDDEFPITILKKEDQYFQKKDKFNKPKMEKISGTLILKCTYPRIVSCNSLDNVFRICLVIRNILKVDCYENNPDLFFLQQLHQKQIISLCITIHMIFA